MKKLFTAFISVFILFFSKNAQANVGDTTFVQGQNLVHMSWWGQYNAYAVFPPAGPSYSKILMDFKLGCPNIPGCSDWDYTVQVEARHHTGIMDSTLEQAPGFTVNGNTTDSLYFNTDTTYVTFYNTISMGTDSAPASAMQIMIFGDTQNPATATDSLWVFPGNYYNYLYNSSGAIYDSVLVPADSLWIVSFTPYYAPFEVIENIELGRVMTPYGGSYSTSWNNTWIFDVTDYAPILHDSIEIHAFYGGWSDGFNLSVDFRMIEGTPPRNPLRVRNIYSSGPGGFPYGNSANPINNYLPPKTFEIGSNETMALMRVFPSGHGAGTQNCAEFCAKNYHVFVDGVQTFDQLVWRTDCGMNSLYHQAGTWLYDRANWCPGEKTVIKNHDLTSLITSGDSVTLDMDFDPFTNSSGNPNYILAAQIITFGSPNFTTDATVDDIISPNDFFNNNRFNPVCSHPVVIIKNTGSAMLTSLDIHYGIEGGIMNTYNWTGSLNFLDTARVTLGSINWGGSPTPDIFKVYVDNPNNSSDQYAYNDTMRSHVTFTPVYPATFVVLLKTNNIAAETSWKLRDESGTILYQNGPLTANTIYRDTVTLANDCYEFTLYDSGKDGLTFFANNAGYGYCRFQKADGTSANIKIFEPDFGTQIAQRFTVGFGTSMEEDAETSSYFNVFPNPSDGNITLDIALEEQSSMELSIYSAAGQEVFYKQFEKFKNDIFSIDLSLHPSGIYFVRMKTNDQVYTKKLVLNSVR